MASNFESSPGTRVRFSITETKESDSAPKCESPFKQDKPSQSGAFAQFFEEFEQESDGMSQQSQTGKNWMASAHESADLNASRGTSDVLDGYNQPIHDGQHWAQGFQNLDSDLVYVGRRGGLHNPLNAGSNFYGVSICA